MKIKDIYIPYSNKQKIHYSSRLLMEMNTINEHDFRFYSFFNIVPGVRVSGINYEERIYFIKIIFANSLKVIDYTLFKSHYKNIEIYEFISNKHKDNPMFVMDINYYTDENTRNIALDDVDYLYFIAMRFKNFIESDEYRRLKQKFKKAR